MKKTSRGFGFLLILMLVTFASGGLYAQSYPIKFALRLTATVQEDTDDGLTTTTLHTSTRVLKNDSILNFVEKALNTKFPLDSSLIQFGFDIVIVDHTGTNILVNLTTNGMASFTFPDRVVQRGRSVHHTGESIRFEKYIFKMSFDDGHGNSFNLAGLARGGYSFSPYDENGNQKYSGWSIVAFAGSGTVGGKDAVFSGTLSRKGKTIY